MNADLPIGNMERSDAKVSAEIASGGKVFAPVETLIENVSASFLFIHDFSFRLIFRINLFYALSQTCEK